MFFNGSGTAGLTINLTGAVADDDVFVLAQSSASATNGQVVTASFGLKP